jgi:hypothetical protein
VSRSGIEFRHIQINKAQKNDATEIGGHLRKNIFVTKIPDGHCRACAVNKLHLLPKIPWDTLIVFTCEKWRMLGYNLTKSEKDPLGQFHLFFMVVGSKNLFFMVQHRPTTTTTFSGRFQPMPRKALQARIRQP